MPMERFLNMPTATQMLYIASFEVEQEDRRKAQIQREQDRGRPQNSLSNQAVMDFLHGA